MRIAFLGKGGSGKTTLSALFSLYADSKKYRTNLLDVDVNSHTAEVLGVAQTEVLSHPKITEQITTFLAGSNPRVQAAEMLNTTPPGGGSGRWMFDDDNPINSLGVKFGKQARVFTLGSYKPNEIGHACHHGTQYIAENMLSHAVLAEDDLLVVDSVAGNDSFANSLYMQDVLVFVLKPEREGVAVFKRYFELAKEAGVAGRVRVIVNQIISQRQMEFIKKELPAEVLLGFVEPLDDVIDARLDNKALILEMINENLAKIFDKVLEFAG